MNTLQKVIQSIPKEIPVLLDVKRGDIGSTASAYADACYDIGAHAVTLSPLMGWDSVEPFIAGKYAHKGAFLLCKTSNPGSNDLLSLSLNSNETLFERIAKLANCWSERALHNGGFSPQTPPPLGLVVGATDADALRKARKAAGERVWILAPGVGAQGGDLDAACEAGFNHQGTCMLIPVSRGISRAEDLSAAAEEYKLNINAARDRVLQNMVPESSIEPYQTEFIQFALSLGVLKFGSFILKSGRTSPYFFNAGLFCTGAALSKLGTAYAASIMASKELVGPDGKVLFDVIFGPAYKGISLGAVVAASLYADFGVDVGFAYNRKEAKDHGEGGLLVGSSMENKRVLVVDDVITAGTAIREAYDMLKQIGATPIGVSIALDRAEKRSLDDPVSAVQAVMRDLELPVVSIVSLPQLQSFLSSSPVYSDDVLDSVVAYREQYGV